jgi:hypothetical protein
VYGFIRYSPNCLTEEMLGIQPMKDTVTGEESFQKMKHLASKYYLSFDKLHGVSTDRAPTMVESKTGLVSNM